METRKMKLALSAGAIALSLALAGCGGGGSPQSPTQAELDAQEAMKRAEMQTAAIMSAISEARAARDSIDDDSPTQAQVTAAATAVTAAEKAIADAADVEDTSSYAATVMDLQSTVTLAQAAVDAGMSVAEAEMEKAAEEAARKEAEEKLAKEEEEKRKAAAAASLKDAKALFTAAAGSTNWNHALPTDITAANHIKPKYGSTTTVSGVDSFDRMVKGEALGKGGTMLDKDGMWSGTMVSAADKATAAVPSDTVVIYTNIGKDTTKDFTEEYAAIVRAETLGGAPTKVAGSDFGAGNAPKEHDNNAKVTGTFDGAMGTYTCGGTDCTSKIGAGDSGIQLDGTWTFKANPGATVMKADADYSYFGWWLEKDAGSPEVFNVHAFEGGMGMANTAVSVEDLSGTAKYMGPAVGKYAMVHDDGDGPSHTGGHFTATADLTADFDMSGKVTGSIKDFVGGSDTMDTWEVKLSGTGPTGTAVWHIGDNKGQDTNTTFSSVFREAKVGDPQTLTGQWQTRFDPQPGPVTGYMIGAFGATKQ